MKGVRTQLLVAMVMFSASPLLAAKDEPTWVFNAPRGAGYSIDLVSVEPAPGTPLTVGTEVEFKITLSYSLTVAKKGTIFLVFQDDKNRSAKPDISQVTQVVSEPKGTITLSDKVTIPKRAKELLLFVPLAPEGMTETTGEVTIVYPIQKK